MGWREWGVLLAIGGVLASGARLAAEAPHTLTTPDVQLSLLALPGYTMLSLGRMLAAYLLSLAFTLVYGYLAAYIPPARQILLPLLDVLQSVPILSFMPVVLLGLSALLPVSLAAELAAIVLIFTSQVWNLTFAWYQSLTTIGQELREASTIFRFNRWLRLKWLELPSAAISLIWNSMMSWAGGFFFLMAAERYSVGNRNFQLPGLGSFLQAAASAGDLSMLVAGIAALVLLVVVLDQLLWRPLLVWAERFKVELVATAVPPTSWFYDWLQASALWRRCGRWAGAGNERLDSWLGKYLAPLDPPDSAAPGCLPFLAGAKVVIVALVVYGTFLAFQLLQAVTPEEWTAIGLALLATLLRVSAALGIALAWTIPVGVAIGTNPRLARWLQPVVQSLASLPATALFPALLLLFLGWPGGLNVAAVILMLLGTQWYLLFNVIAGAAAIPQDLQQTAVLLHLSRLARWRSLILPALFPAIVTGSITASGGAWNASVVAEYTEFGGHHFAVLGIGATLAQATAAGNYALLLAATLALVITVVAINRLLWRRLYDLASEKFRME